MENSNDTGKVIGALMIGAAIGGLLGILFAPDKGSKTRKNIFNQGKGIVEAATEKINEFVETTKNEFQKSREKASQTVQEGRTKV